MIALDLSLENLYRQYYRCRRNKRNTVNALRFEAEQEKNLIHLREQLLSRSYRPGRSVCFFTTRPKLREIFAADFRDRVVHHLLVEYLERIWEPLFIHDSYACRPGKGVHRGVTRLQQFLRQATANGTRRAWYLQLDIHNYFMSMDRDILYRLLAARMSDETALWLTGVLVFHDCTENYVMRGRPELLARLPAHKTLFGAAPGKGMPIGNLNSQFFANVYLNGLDQFVKHELKCRHYLRYCDDFVLLGDSPERLGEWRERIGGYLRDELALELNPRQRLTAAGNGVDFLGYVVRHDYRLVRRRVVGHLRERLGEFERRLVTPVEGGTRYAFDRPVLDELAAALASYLGHLRHAASWRLWQSLWARFDYLRQYFDFDAVGWRLVRRYLVPEGFRRVREQYRWFRRRFPGDVLLFQVGRFCEFYSPGDAAVAAELGLQPMRRNHRGANFGFPKAQLDQYVACLRDLRQPALAVAEQTAEQECIQRRLPVARYVWRCA
ncbi:MAG: hypothetical protein AMXMBFR8_14890 [Nevskiales bacterium]